MTSRYIYLIIFLLLLCFISNSNEFLFKSRSSSTIKIGSFNLRRYSISKATSTKSTNTYIAKILKRYDLVFLQEIIDPSNDNRVINQLLNHLHKQSKSIKYEAIVSPTLGSTSYKERLVYLYRKKSSKFQILSSYVYNGTISKQFERAPFILHIKLASFGEIIFIGVHLKPTNVYNEFLLLHQVINEFKKRTSMILLGDFNADCSYLNNQKKNDLKKNYFSDFQWLIDDHIETNLLQSCSYDRILVTSDENSGKKINWKPKTIGVFPFDKKFHLTKENALQVSDHYPVEVDIY